MTAPTCPYCQRESVLMDSARIYDGKSHGLIYRCDPCGAHVGVHRGTIKPLGRLANLNLRRLKMKAHSALDPIWQKIIDNEIIKKGFAPPGIKTMARDRVYKQLAHALDIPRDECHIGMFNETQCRRTIEICTRWMKIYKDEEKKDERYQQEQSTAGSA